MTSFAVPVGRVALAAMLWAVGLAPAAAQGLTREAVAEQVAREFGVEVLRAERGEADGKPVYIVTVMSPAGDYNAAFQVSRLMVDAASGALVSQFRHRDAGYDLSGGLADYPMREGDGTAMRRRSLR